MDRRLHPSAELPAAEPGSALPIVCLSRPGRYAGRAHVLHQRERLLVELPDTRRSRFICRQRHSGFGFEEVCIGWGFFFPSSFRRLRYIVLFALQVLRRLRAAAE